MKFIPLLATLRVFIFPLLALIALNLCLDFIIRWRVKRRYGSRGAMFYLASAAFTQAIIAGALCLPAKGASDTMLLAKMWLFLTYFSIYLPKAVYCAGIGISMIPKLWHGRPWRLAPVTGLLLGIVLFGVIWWGALVTRLSPRVTQLELPVKELPSGLDGMRIVHISDLHTGTHGNSNTFLEQLVEYINVLHPDLVCFTGDIVNRHTGELENHWQTLSRIEPPVVAILGNHDYGDYRDWDSEIQKTASMRRLHTLVSDSMGWHLLLDRTIGVVRRGDTLDMVGVENIGDPPFPTYGSMTRATASARRHSHSILLTHNPRHWNDSIAGNRHHDYFLTLSGHTHAMQMEVWGWSPAIWRYPQWGGLYTDSLGRNLYVNIGAGTVGLPVRIGQANPEITLITLRRRVADAQKQQPIPSQYTQR